MIYGPRRPQRSKRRAREPLEAKPAATETEIISARRRDLNRSDSEETAPSVCAHQGESRVVKENF